MNPDTVQAQIQSGIIFGATACQRRTESPQKWRRKIPQLAGWRSAVDVISTSVFWWPAPPFQG
ncbi:hypothetical protein, partial [Bradyrhizobium vignae]|uniref:hypothetical protein n=1 Tax=Bradyrhizobium vignae TaxID=1549949 RepID=UPI001ABFDC13